MPTYVKGALAKVTANAVDLCVTSWTVAEEADEIDVTNTCSLGEDEFEAGTVRTSVSVEAVYDNDVPENTQPAPDINAGSTVACVVFVGDTGKVWSGDLKVFNHAQTSEVKNVVRYSFAGKFTGTVTKPV